MTLRKLQLAGAVPVNGITLAVNGQERRTHERREKERRAGFYGLKFAGRKMSQLTEDEVRMRNQALLYSSVALGVLAGAAISTYLWRQRVQALELLNASPLERAEELIASCESKLEDIERAFEDMKAGR